MDNRLGSSGISGSAGAGSTEALERRIIGARSVIPASNYIFHIAFLSLKERKYA